ncbi:MAG TPA: tRNA uridine-5-carboxymethylaminomethyl(34) synthesis enzyme MnmG [Candidatus Sulfotelmatobacter sp.]|nr:tRNA uridine-5-carboxymethylaminomethyl(34) synthesis enzyme MnmG [Candidatus Sulfotelmatobacter sp.]
MFTYPKEYDVIVVGAGHAGIEAALAAARLGCQTLLLTQNVDSIGQMSCNPAIGGLAKGHLVREIDALGGQMGKTTDYTGIQFRMLNKSNGPAVWAPRAQCDKKAYQFRQKLICESTANLDLIQDQTKQLLTENGQVRGLITLLGIHYRSKTVILTTGTFLRGLLHVGEKKQTGGRMGDVSAESLTGSLNQLGIETARLKTGTPPRLLLKSLDLEKTEIQPGDEPPPKFSHWSDDMFHVEQSRDSKGWRPAAAQTMLESIGHQVPCYLTYTTAKTAEIIRANLHKSPMYSGQIEGIGPRYCPSIEDKIVKFSDKEKHQIFLEPEGTQTEEVYVNGLSTSLPFDVQIELVRSVIGCERAHIMRPAYAVEYDFVHPQQLQPWLETKVCQNLFLAGQINGTSGYEEAAAQGLMAGINAALRIQSKNPLVLRRDQAYIGVLIDDLVTKGTTEPYRMFTSRAEHRLLLRQDNADLRLAKIGHEIGLLSSQNLQQVLQKEEEIERELERLRKTIYNQKPLLKLLARPEMKYEELPGKMELPADVIQQVEIAAKYAGYIDRQELEVKRVAKMEEKEIPKNFDYALVPSLCIEARQKFSKIRPATVGQAARISGISPADVGVLLIGLKRWSEIEKRELADKPNN